MSVYRDMMNANKHSVSQLETPGLLGYDKEPNHLIDELSGLAQRLEQLQRTKSAQVLMFTSVDSGAGVTTISRGLVQLLTYGESNEDEGKLLFIDCTARTQDGLPRFLAEGAALEECLDPTKHPHCDILSGSILDGGWMRRVKASNMLDRISELRARYRWIILDMPEAMHSENLMWAAVCDGLIIVLESGKTRQMAAKAVIEYYASFSVSVMGTVINKRKMEIPEYIYNKLFRVN
jgi:Mrp family chromosome partitioning ATPase